MGNLPTSDSRIVFTARNAAGDEFALVTYDNGNTAVLKNGTLLGEPCPNSDSERCVRLLLTSIGFEQSQ